MSPGDFIILDNKKQKVSEVLRSSGIQDVLREVWPIVKKDDEVIWIPGLRKSDLSGKKFYYHIKRTFKKINLYLYQTCGLRFYKKIPEN